MSARKRASGIHERPWFNWSWDFTIPPASQEIADLEAEIDELAQAAERCRKVIVLAKVMTGAGGLLFAVPLIGLVRSGPAALVLAIAGVLGGLALVGSHASTRDQIRSKIGALEARRAQLIAELDLRDVGANERE